MKIRARRVKYRRLSRLRHSTQFLRWIAEQADRLEITEEELFDQMRAGATAQDIEATPTPEPEEPEDPIP